MKIKQEILSLESDDTNFDYAEFLKTYDPEKEYTDSDESSSEADMSYPKFCPPFFFFLLACPNQSQLVTIWTPHTF
jgi:hypothetical protein